MSLGRELARSLAGTGIAPRMISDREWRLGELTAVIGEQRAELRYAREPVGRAPLEGAAIVAAVHRARARLEARSRAPDLLLPALAEAYARVCAARRVRDGERVPLVELRGALDTTRAQFAWDLARLQREHRLVFGARRIDLGVATGHAAVRRSRVVWIENAAGSGAYYETFRLTPEARRDQALPASAGRRAHRRAGAPHPRADGRER